MEGSRRRLLVVADTFAISGRGTVVAPGVDLGPLRSRLIAVELRRPDGTIARATAAAEVPFLAPPPAAPLGHMLRFANLGKADLPAGTEIWLVDD